LNNIVRMVSQARLPLAMLLVAAACGDVQPTGPSVAGEPLAGVQAFDCTASVASGTVSCSSPLPAGPSLAILGGQDDYLRLTSSNVTAVNGIFQFEVTVQNLLPEAMGTPDGVTPDTAGINVFFFGDPVVTAGTGTVTVANEDGSHEYMGPDQPYFRYNQVLVKDQVSAPRTWQLAYAPGVQTFTFRVLVVAELQPLLVINEVLANPKSNGLPAGVPAVADPAGEWFEVYNAGRFAVEMVGMLVADSSGGATGKRQPYHVILSSLVVEPGAYVVIGSTTNSASNGGTPVDYAYGTALQLSNSGSDAVKISRVYGVADTLTVDRVAYSLVGSTVPSAKDGISRELLNPALDNSNIDGSSWADAVPAATYGAANTRGTPKSQNSTFTP
jgi:hypothetical protein